MTSKNFLVEIDNKEKSKVVEESFGAKRFSLPAQVEYYSKESNLTLRYGWVAYERRFQVHRLLHDINVKTWADFLAKLPD
ncbi:MAG: hypothetical protein ABII21_04540 [bacterium]